MGRLDDISSDGRHLVADIVHGMAAEVIVSSVRHPMHVVEAAKIGAHIAPIPCNVIQSLVRHPLTDIGLKQVLADWEKVPEKPF